jgi:hypothetical protein
MKRTLLVAVGTALLLAACAPATPTIDPAQIQASAMAAASTMIAQTIAAQPTATPVPPTPTPSATPLPVPTLPPLPTIAVASPTTASSGDDCNHQMDVSNSGPMAKVVILNSTKGSATFTLYLGRPNSFGQCGYISWGPIRKLDRVTAEVPFARLNQGDPCYWASAFVNDPKQQRTPANGPFCINDTDKWTFEITYETIKLTPP